MDVGLKILDYFDYIDDECMKYDLSIYTPLNKIEEYYSSITGLDDDNTLTVHEKRDYLYNYVLDNLIKDNKITPLQKEEYLMYILQLEKYYEDSLDNMIEILSEGRNKRNSVALVRKINSCYQEYAVVINYKNNGNKIKWEYAHFYDDINEAKRDYIKVLNSKKFNKNFFKKEYER